MATKAEQRAADKAVKLNDDHTTRRAPVALDPKLLAGVQTGVKFPTRTRGAGSVNSGVLASLRELVTPLTIGDTFRLNAPADEHGQQTLANLVRKAINVTHGYDMGVNIAVQDGFMFVELKKRKVRNPKSE